jgi:hypothetical protein
MILYSNLDYIGQDGCSAGCFKSVPKLVMNDFHTIPGPSECCLVQPKMPFSRNWQLAATFCESELRKVVQGCARLRKVVQGCARLCKVAQGCARLCKVAQGCARLRKVVQGCARLCKVVQGCTRLCKVAQGCTTLCNFRSKTLMTIVSCKLEQTCYIGPLDSPSRRP